MILYFFFITFESQEKAVIRFEFACGLVIW